MAAIFATCAGTDVTHNGWTRDLSGALRSRVRESLVREVRANLLAGVTPSEAAIVDAAAARGVEVGRSHRRDIVALRGAAAVLPSELRARRIFRVCGGVVRPVVSRSCRNDATRRPRPPSDGTVGGMAGTGERKPAKKTE